MRTLKAQMRATRFGLESRLGRQLAHDDPILMWIPTFAGDTIARFRKGPDGKTPWEREREQGRKWAGDSLEFDEHFFMEEAKERGSGAAKKDWEPRLIEAKYLGHGRYHCRRHCLWKTWTSITRSRALGSDRLARSQRNAVGSSTDGRGQRRRSILRLTQTQARQSEERDVAETQGRAESARPRDEAPRRGVQEERAAAPASASDAAKTEPSAKRTRGETLKQNNSMLAGRM